MSEKKYFAAANTTGGFRSYYDEVFGKCERTYIIKGGSGTGKSHFMRECAKHAEAKLECKSVEYFYCSFDPSSLDGIIINGDIAIIDGTAPHVYEPTMPGARENLVDLGRFWDSGKLAAKKEKLSELFSMKKECFSRAYSYLGACGELDKIKQGLVAPSFDDAKISAAAAKLVSSLGREEGNGKGRETRIVSALGRSGKTYFDTYEKTAKKVYRMYDGEGASHILLDRIMDEARRFDIPVCVSYDPLFAKRPNAVLLGDTAIIATNSVEDESMQPYFKDGFFSEVERILKINEMQTALATEAIKEFERASKIHFGIEEIYVDAMDFSKKEEFTAEFLEKLKI